MSRAESVSSTVFINIIAIVLVVGLHAAVLAQILTPVSTHPDIEQSQTVEIRFVDIAPQATQAAEKTDTENTAAAVPAPDSAPEPMVDQPVPEPSAEPERASLPEPELPAVVEPEPAVALEPETKLVPEPTVEPELKVEPPPKAEPKPKPQPKPQPKPIHKPTRTPTPEPAAKPAARKSVSMSTSASRDAAAATSQARVGAAPQLPVDPGRPRLIGRVSYLGKRPNPHYPRASVRWGETGRVIVRVLISPRGTVKKATVRTSSGHSRLDKAAVHAVLGARFKPYTENGVPYPAMADIPFDFVL